MKKGFQKRSDVQGLEDEYLTNSPGSGSDPGISKDNIIAEELWAFQDGGMVHSTFPTNYNIIKE